MSRLLKGAPVAEALSEEARTQSALLVSQGIVPTLALLRLGERGDDLAYERGILRRCEKSGVTPRKVELPADASPERVRETVAGLSADAAVHGILLFRPLPFDDADIRAAAAPGKDVDGMTAGSMAAVYTGAGEGFAPCTAEACLALLRHYEVPLAGRRAVVVGRSLVIGRPLALLLLRENATVTIAHSKTPDLAAVCRGADLVIAAAGRAGLLGAEHLKAGQTVVDVGVHVRPDGSLCGDVRFEEAEAVADAVTPVPGGVGPITAAVLCRNTVLAAARAGQ